MQPNYVCWGGLEAYRRGVTLTNFVLVKMVKILRNVLDGVNALSHQCIDEEC